MAIITHIDISALHYVAYIIERNSENNFLQKFPFRGRFIKSKSNKRNKIQNSYPQTITYHTVGSTSGVKVNISCLKERIDRLYSRKQKFNSKHKNERRL